MTDRPKNLRELRESGYHPVDVKTEMRRNLITKLRHGTPLFRGILGYEETVFPQIQNAILSKHDMLFLGLRGQGKTRMLRMPARYLLACAQRCHFHLHGASVGAGVELAAFAARVTASAQATFRLPELAI